MARRRHCVLVGVDGLQYERLEGLLNSCCDDGYNKLLMFRGFTGGYTGTSSQQATVSSPGWTTILTGAWSWKHHVPRNDAKLASDVPSVFHRINEHAKTPDYKGDPPRMFSFTSWDVINQNLSLNDYITEAKVLPDALAVERAVEVILTDENPTLIFAYIGDIDEVGHSKCFSDTYDKAVLDSDEKLGNILKAIEQRMERIRNPVKTEIIEDYGSTDDTSNTYEMVDSLRRDFDGDEEWMVMVVTDHGRDAFGCEHGGQSQTEKTIFYGLWFCNVENKDEVLKNLELRSHQGGDILPDKGHSIPFSLLYNSPPQTCITPTLLSFLNVPIAEEWMLDGRSLLEAANPPSIDCAFVDPTDTIYWGVSRSVHSANINNKDGPEQVQISIRSSTGVVEEVTVPYSTGRWKSTKNQRPGPGESWDVQLRVCDDVFWTRILGAPKSAVRGKLCSIQ